jgi:hypothetical protein
MDRWRLGQLVIPAPEERSPPEERIRRAGTLIDNGEGAVPFETEPRFEPNGEREIDETTFFDVDFFGVDFGELGFREHCTRSGCERSPQQRPDGGAGARRHRRNGKHVGRSRTRPGGAGS